MSESSKRPKITKAVALHWDREHAPRITATGTGLTAEQILKVAEEHDIPLRADPVLVEALAQIPLGAEIPRALYVAVAEVLAFVFMLEGIDPRVPTLIPAERNKQRAE
ncbi:MAG: EscU/YscU/HrcU family type III secretion system export apparatus switch protein [Chromatiales bacterium]|nr:EscU/YscU/HrcU family type III secretion system export apparatus switch protein [Chromatiales bacterium]